MQGLAVRLNPHEAIMKREDYTIKLEPRELYKPKNEHLICMPDGGHAPNPENPPENELRESFTIRTSEKLRFIKLNCFCYLE